MIVGKRQGLVHECTQLLGVVWPCMILLLKDDVRVLADGYGADVGAGVDMQYAGHNPLFLTFNKVQRYAFFCQQRNFYQKLTSDDSCFSNYAVGDPGV